MKVYLKQEQFVRLVEQLNVFGTSSSGPEEVKKWCKTNIDDIVQKEVEIDGDKWSIQKLVNNAIELAPDIFEGIEIDGDMVEDYWEWPSVLKYVLPIPSFKYLCTQAYNLEKQIDKTI